MLDGAVSKGGGEQRQRRGRTGAEAREGMGEDRDSGGGSAAGRRDSILGNILAAGRPRATAVGAVVRRQATREGHMET